MAKNETLYSTFQGWNETFDLVNGTSSGKNFVNLPGLQREVYISSVKTPGFRFLKKKHLLPLNGYSKSADVISSPPITFTQDIGTWGIPPSHPYYAKGRKDFFYNAMVFPGTAPLVVASADDPLAKAINDLMSKLTDGKTNTMVTAAEMNKTARSVVKTATRLYTSMRALKHGDFLGFTTALGITSQEPGAKKRFNKRYAKAKSRDAQEHRYTDTSFNTTTTVTRMSSFQSETWLEYKYAWKPLLKDVFDHAKALAELNIERQHAIRFAYGKAATERSAQSTFKDPNPGWNSTQVSKETRAVKIGVWYRLQNNQLNTFIQLGIDNPMEVVWEVIPLSFVADWFIPVGEYLKNLTATNGLVFHAGFKTTRRSAKCSLQVVANGNTARYGITQIGPQTGQGAATREIFEMSRSRLTGFPGPVFPGFRDPRDTKDGGISRATSAIALLQSLFLKQKSSQSKYL